MGYVVCGFCSVLVLTYCMLYVYIENVFSLIKENCLLLKKTHWVATPMDKNVYLSVGKCSHWEMRQTYLCGLDPVI